MINRSLLAILLLLVPCLSKAAVPLDPNTARGFAGKVYQLGDVDNVNVFNGNLTVRIPIGQRYSSGPLLAYQLVLTNNSKVWDYEGVEYDQMDGQGPYKRRAIPEDFSNAGLGWKLSLGRLLPPRPPTRASDSTVLIEGHGYIYLGSDGTQREFFETLRAGDTDSNATTLYTTDGSYLRLTLKLPASNNTIEFPDGTVHEFNSEGLLQKISDRFDNWVKVGYGTVPCGATLCDVWTITDGHGLTSATRSHTINFTNKSLKYNQKNFKQVVSSVTLATFGSSTATYTFHYADDDGSTATTIGRGGCGDLIDTDPSFVKAPLLDSVTLPDNSTFSMQYLQSDTGTCSSGALSRLALPTGGALEWEYKEYVMTLQQCSQANFWTASFGGVRKRSVYPRGASTPEAVWTYTPTLVPNRRTGVYTQNCNGEKSVELPFPQEALQTVIVGPTGDKTIHYFSAYPPMALPANSDYAKGWEYGLPFTRSDELEAGGAALSSVEYDCAQPTACIAEKKTYVEYENDGWGENRALWNSRLSGQTVEFQTDSGCGGKCRIDTAHSDFDGYGHYRQTIASSNFPGSESRTTVTNFNPGSSSTGKDSTLSEYFAPGERWITGTYNSASVSQGSTGRDTESVFDANTGVLKSVKTLRGDKEAVLTAWCREGDAGARGFVTSERHVGGDLDAIPSDECSASRSASHFFINHAYTFAGADLTKHTAQYDGTTHFIADEDFDVSTGLVKTSRDSAEIATSYEYDSSGRLKIVRPTGAQAGSTYLYDLANDPASLVIQQCVLPSGAYTCSTPLTEARYYFDGLGRLTQERRKMSSSEPGITPAVHEWSAQWTKFDPLGRVESRSVPVISASGLSGADTSTAETSWLYDFLGRVKRETRPELSYTSFDYAGSREIRRSVADTSQAPPKLRSTERYDGAGRLMSVIQPSGPTSAADLTGDDRTTGYTYDFADRLRTVTMNGGTTTSQDRTFEYDPAGFLTQESHPETGIVKYESHDARGHARKRIPPGLHSAFKHQYSYDAAERLIQIDTGEPCPGDPACSGEFRLAKQFEFATENDGTNKKKGKLEKATRMNYPDRDFGGVKIEVKETYGYDSVGRTSTRTTVISDLTYVQPALIKSINQTFAYNELGLPSTLSYPVCTDCGVPPVATPKRNIALTYPFGFLKTVAGYVSDITYSPAGTPTEIERANGVDDTIALDTSGRPLSFTFGTWSSCGVPAAIDIQPAPATIESGSTATLEVSASGSDLQYQWYDGSSETLIMGAQARTYTTPPLTASKSYFVRIRNSCRSVDSETVEITVTCTPPAITTPPQSQTIVAGTEKMLTVVATGTSLSYQWYRGASADISQPVGTNSPSYTTPALSVTTAYWVRVTGACGTEDSAAATLTVPLATPTGLSATMDGPSSVLLTWTSVPGADKYQVWRRSGSGSFTLLSPSPSASPWVDTGRSSGTTYVYRIRAIDANGGSASSFSNHDLSTLTTFSAIVAGSTVIDDAYWHELLTALNALRAANGDAALTWTGIAPGFPAPAANGEIFGVYLEKLRLRFTSALQALGVPAPGYTDPNLATSPGIRAIYITELQLRTQ